MELLILDKNLWEDSGDLTNPVDLGTVVEVESPEDWNDTMGYFMQEGGNVFDGLFKYTLQSDGSYAYEIAPSQLTLDSASQLLPDIIGYGKNGNVTGDGSIYDNTLSPEEYQQALNTANEIKGGNA